MKQLHASFRYRRARLWLMLGLLVALGLSACAGSSIQITTHTAGIGLAESADIRVDVPYQRATLSTLNTNAINILEAELEHVGSIDFSVENDEDDATIKHIDLSENVPEELPEDAEALVWDLRLTTNIPSDLTLNVSGGDLRADMTRLNLQDIALGVTEGSLNALLPASSGWTLGTVQVEGGELTLVTTPGQLFAAEDILVSGGTLTINVPFEAPVQISINAQDTATVTVPDSYSESSDDTSTLYASSTYVEGDDALRFHVEASGGEVIVQYRAPPTEDDAAAEDAETTDE